MPQSYGQTALIHCPRCRDRETNVIRRDKDAARETGRPSIDIARYTFSISLGDWLLGAGISCPICKTPRAHFTTILKPDGEREHVHTVDDRGFPYRDLELVAVL